MTTSGRRGVPWLAIAVALAIAAGCMAPTVGSTPPPAKQSVPQQPHSAQPAETAQETPTKSPLAGQPSPAVTGSATTTAIVPGVVNRTSIRMVATYDVNATVRYGDRRVSTTSTMSVQNASGGPVDGLELATVTARIGGLQLGAVTVDGKTVSPSISDQTILVPLGGILPNGAIATVRLVFRATLRSDLSGSNWLFTRTNGIIDANRWLPWISLPRQFSRPNHGEPFYTASSPFVRFRVTTDRAMLFATAGLRTAASGLTQTFEARNVRDFNFAASPFYSLRSATVGNTIVKVYYRAGYPASTVLSYARSAIARMGALVGTYPYRTFVVAQSAGAYGMESPQMIWIPGGLSGSHLRWLVHHETAHQWFYGIVGSDQALQPFADEAAADHLARYVTGIWRPSRCSTARLDLSIYSYSATCYFEVIYIQGSAVLDWVRSKMGTTNYWRAMRDYVAAHRFGLGSTPALLSNLDAHASYDFRAAFARRFPRFY
jgi:hypothetical protein